MAEITFTLPGAIPYSNVVVKATPEELGVDISDAYGVGVAATVFLNLFTQGIEAGKKIDVSPRVQEASEPAVTSTELYEKNLAGQSMEETKAILSKQDLEMAAISGFHDVEADAREMLEAGLGSTTEVPWKKAVKADPKAWEEPKPVVDVQNDDMF